MGAFFFAGLYQGGNEHQKGNETLGYQLPVVNPETLTVLQIADKFPI